MDGLGQQAMSAGDAGASNPDAKDYLAEMAKSYTTEEQRRIHDGGSATAITPQAIDFF